MLVLLAVQQCDVDHTDDVLATTASDDKHTIAKVGNMCYFLGKIAQIIVLREPIMALSSGEWQLIAVLSVLSVATLLVGIRLRRYLPQARFRQLIFSHLTILVLVCVAGYC